MPPKFGTSGLRGLVTELTDPLVGDHVRAFAATCATGGAIRLGWDLRPSSPDIAAMAERAALAAGLNVISCGAVPTPALALAASRAGSGAIMVTGSHIPADRNGLKFYTPNGEITKANEAAITAALNDPHPPARAGKRQDDPHCLDLYIDRYADAFGAQALAGLRIGVYEHSSVARDALGGVLRALGAETVGLARSDQFIPVDTEAVDPDTRTQLCTWVRDNALDAIVSTDGDGDRPMVADAGGQIVPGDVLGPLTAQALTATEIVTPVSSNSLVDQMQAFARIHRTRIGSPYVIAEMQAVLARDPQARVVGYEANGGFLLGFDTGALRPLMTRDSLLPIVAPLTLARRRGVSLADLAASLPPRFTATDRLQGVAPEASARFLARLSGDASARVAFFSGMGSEAACDLTDGLRVTFAGGDVVHLRPSGNAPEFRCYTEAGSRREATDLLARHLARLAGQFG